MKRFVDFSMILGMVVLTLTVKSDGAATLYVDGNVTASGDGLTWETAKKTIQDANVASGYNTERLILIRGDQQYDVGNLELTRGGESAAGRKVFRGVPGTNGMDRLPIVSGANNYDEAAFSSTGTHDQVYWIPESATFIFNAWEGPAGGEWGDAWDLYTEMSDVDGVQTNPGSWHHDGATLFVHTSDGTHPSNFIIKSTSANNCFQIHQSYFSFENLEFRHARGATARLMASAYTHATFRSNIVHHTGGTGLESLGNADVDVLDNTVYAVAGAGIALGSGGSNVTISGNRIFNNNIGVQGDGSQLEIFANEIYSNAIRGVFLTGGAENALYNNLIYANGGVGIWVRSASTAVYQNSFYQNGSRQIWFNLASATNGRAFNNILWANGSGAVGFEVDSAAVTGFQSDYNLLYATDGANAGKWANANKMTLTDWQTDSGQDANSLSADPRFMDPASGDFRLTAPSPARDMGTAAFAGVGAPTIDVEGTERPINLQFDLGAYEYQPTGTMILIQ